LSEWDLSKRQLLRSIPDVSWPARFAPDQWLFYQSTNGVGFHDLHSGATYNPIMFPRPLSNLDGSPGASPDGRLLAVPHDAGNLTVWETRHLFSNDRLQPLQTLGGILLSFSTAVFSPDGTRLLGCAPGPETIKIWDTSSWHELLTLSADDGISRWQSGFSLDDRDLVLGTWALVVWRAASWAEINEAEKREAVLAP
jgi:WD40 repeat protein